MPHRENKTVFLPREIWDLLLEEIQAKVKAWNFENRSPSSKPPPRLINEHELVALMSFQLHRKRIKNFRTKTLLTRLKIPKSQLTTRKYWPTSPNRSPYLLGTQSGRYWCLLTTTNPLPTITWHPDVIHKIKPRAKLSSMASDISKPAPTGLSTISQRIRKR